MIFDLGKILPTNVVTILAKFIHLELLIILNEKLSRYYRSRILKFLLEVQGEFCVSRIRSFIHFFFFFCIFGAQTRKTIKSMNKESFLVKNARWSVFISIWIGFKCTACKNIATRNFATSIFFRREKVFLALCVHFESRGSKLFRTSPSWLARVLFCKICTV